MLGLQEEEPDLKPNLGNEVLPAQAKSYKEEREDKNTGIGIETNKKRALRNYSWVGSSWLPFP